MTKEFLNLKDPFDEPKVKKKYFAKQKKKVIGKRLLKATYRLHKDEHGNAIVHYLARRSLIYNEEFSPFYDVEDFNMGGHFRSFPSTGPLSLEQTPDTSTNCLKRLS